MIRNVGGMSLLLAIVSVIPGSVALAANPPGSVKGVPIEEINGVLCATIDGKRLSGERVGKNRFLPYAASAANEKRKARKLKKRAEALSGGRAKELLQKARRAKRKAQKLRNYPQTPAPHPSRCSRRDQSRAHASWIRPR